MTNNRFISALRDYAALARARRVSYAPAVQRLVQLRMEAVEQGDGTPEEMDAKRAEIQSAAAREYGKFDAAFGQPVGN